MGSRSPALAGQAVTDEQREVVALPSLDNVRLMSHPTSRSPALAGQAVTDEQREVVALPSLDKLRLMSNGKS